MSQNRLTENIFLLNILDFNKRVIKKSMKSSNNIGRFVWKRTRKYVLYTKRETVTIKNVKK
ncbi:hypothetical protein Mgra_00005909 [Meloidogyne graminicola]|uniref:Uncharacterized protein n=1 Tax=Meloidogyne graminicola TaxID=189291 RepID=A0A8S9ZMN0_9BILA|nr:hypothetical protein Mgra_00005909 [Meloidogyne graminicola]